MAGGADNLAIVLTAPGASAIAVVRLLGPNVGAFLEKHFSKPAKVGRAVHGELSDGTEVIDDPVVVLLPDGGADLSLHGGPWVVSAVLELAQRDGFAVERFDPASPRLEAFDGANILEKQASAHLPLASTELGVRVLVSQPAAWSDLVSRSLPGPGETAHLSRWLPRAEVIRGELGGILADKSLWWLLHPPTVAIIGAPNVGKSTLANRLFARELAITADLPGTTRDWVGEIANLDGLPVMLVDTPGLRQTSDPIEAQAIRQSEGKIKSADLVVVVIDATRPLEEQAEVLEAWPEALRVVNKVDAPAAFDLALIHGLRTVGTTGQGIAELARDIRARFGVTPGFDPAAPRWWTKRQKEILEESIGRVELIGRMNE